MKWLLTILTLIIVMAHAGPGRSSVSMGHSIVDTVPSGVPQLFGSKYYKFNGYILVDSFIMTAAGDTNNIPYFPSLEFKSSNNRWYGWDRTRWQAFLIGTDTISLSNRINAAQVNQTIQQVLNTGDTARRPIIYNYNNPDTTDEIYTWANIPSNFGISYGAEGVQMGLTAGWHRFNGVNASGRPNVVFNLAQYNTSNGGGRINGSEAAYRFGLETHFNTGGQRLFEFHLPELVTYDGTYSRPFTMYVNKETGQTQFNYYSTGGVDYQTRSGRYLFNFGENGNFTFVGYGGGSVMTLCRDSLNGPKYQLNYSESGLQHNTFGMIQSFDSKVEMSNVFSNDPILDVRDHRNANTAGLRIHIDGTSSPKVPIQVDANTSGGVDVQVLNGAGPSQVSTEGFGGGTLRARNSNTSDPLGAGYNNAYSIHIAGGFSAFVYNGVNYGQATAVYQNTQAFSNTNIAMPYVWYIADSEKFRINANGNVGINTSSPAYGLYVNRTLGANKDSVTLQTTTDSRQMLVIDTANGKFERMDIPGGGSPIWVATGTDAYYNNTGNVGIGDATPDVKLDIESGATGSDGIFITNTNDASSARTLLRLSNDIGELGQLGIFSSTHATLPSVTTFESTKGFRVGTDAGVASGGTSNFEIVTGGYSVAAAFTVKGTGVLNGSSLSGTGTRMVVADASGDLSTQAIPSIGNTIYTGDGTLASDRTVSTGGFTTTWTGSNDNETSFSVANTGTTNASAIAGSATGTTSIGVSGTSSSYIGVFGTSTSNNGVQGQSSSGVGVIGVSTTGAGLRAQINPSSNNTIEYARTVLRTSSSGAGANGIGVGDQYELETATSGNSQIAGSIAFEWTDATNATRTSRFRISGVNSTTDVTLATFDGNGNATFGTTNSIVGTATNNNAVAGNIGEYVSSTIALGSAVALSTTTTANVTSISLTAGDWDVTGVVDYAMTSATATNFQHGASITSATLGGQDMYVQKPFAFAGSSATFGDAVPVSRISLASTTTIYLVAQATFSGGSIDAYGTIRARRVR